MTLPPAPPPRPAPPAGGLTWTLAWRYLRGHRSRLLNSTARAAVVSNALGVAAMVIAMALMTGYSEDLERKLLGSGAAVIAYPLGDEPKPEVHRGLLEGLARTDGVREVSRILWGEGSLSSSRHPQGLVVTIRGVDPGRGALGGTPGQLAVGDDGIVGTVLGNELARKLEAQEGDVLRLAAVGFDGRRSVFRYRSLRVSGTFTTGFAESDRNWLILDRGVVEDLGGSRSLYEITLTEGREVGQVHAAAEEVLGDGFLVTDWRRQNRELFTALALQKLVLFLVLGLIVVVSTFNVASTLVVLVREKIRELGVLGALGLKPRQVQRIFVLCGGALGGAGILLGIALGWGAAWVLTTFELIRFDPEVAAIYFISSVPFRVKVLDVLAVVFFTSVVTLLACWFPARRAARLDPAAALRYE